MPSPEPARRSDRVCPLAALPAGATAVVVRVNDGDRARAGRLAGLGVTRGARLVVLQTFPGVVVLCDETELVVERAVALHIYVQADGTDRLNGELGSP
jgi:Fe2+ transport system protein FeoA